jgi:hypothetical protein
MAYLTTATVLQTTHYQIIGLLMNNELETMWKEMVVD